MFVELWMRIWRNLRRNPEFKSSGTWQMKGLTLRNHGNNVNDDEQHQPPTKLPDNTWKKGFVMAAVEQKQAHI